MAVIHTGSIVSQIKGSVGNETYSRNQGGAYVRGRAGPAGPPTANQLAITAAMTALSQAWSATLTDSQRRTWRQYANEFPLPNRWGEPLLTNGYSRFVSVNFPEQVRTSALFRTLAPTAPPLAPPLYDFNVSWADEEAKVITPFTRPLPNDSSFRAYLYLGIDMPLGVNFYASPFQFISTNTKINGVWTGGDWEVEDVPITRNEDSHRWARMRILDTVTGAISTPGLRMITTQEEL